MTLYKDVKRRRWLHKETHTLNYPPFEGWYTHNSTYRDIYWLPVLVWVGGGGGWVGEIGSLVRPDTLGEVGWLNRKGLKEEKRYAHDYTQICRPALLEFTIRGVGASWEVGGAS